MSSFCVRVCTSYSVLVLICNGYLICFQAAAELKKRKENFSKEMDFVVANVVSYEQDILSNKKFENFSCL